MDCAHAYHMAAVLSIMLCQCSTWNMLCGGGGAWRGRHGRPASPRQPYAHNSARPAYSLARCLPSAACLVAMVLVSPGRQVLPILVLIARCWQRPGTPRSGRWWGGCPAALPEKMLELEAGCLAAEAGKCCPTLAPECTVCSAAAPTVCRADSGLETATDYENTLAQLPPKTALIHSLCITIFYRLSGSYDLGGLDSFTRDPQKWYFWT